MSTLHRAGCCTERTRVLVLKLWRDQKPNMKALQVQCSHLRQPANISQMSEHGEGIGNSINFWRLLEHWFEALIWAAFELMWHLSHRWSCRDLSQTQQSSVLRSDWCAPSEQGSNKKHLWYGAGHDTGFEPNSDPLCIIIYDICRSSGFCFGCWFGSWILETIFRNCRIPSEPCKADLLNNLSCFPWVW